MVVQDSLRWTGSIPSFLAGMAQTDGTSIATHHGTTYSDRPSFADWLAAVSSGRAGLRAGRSRESASQKTFEAGLSFAIADD